MLNSLLEVASSLVFPVECETCSKALSPLPPLGVCEKCFAEIQWIKPPFCQVCGRPLRFEGPKCGECQTESFYFDRAIACALYDGKMKELLHAYKFSQRKYLKNFFVKILTDTIKSNLSHETFDVMAAVPLDQEKKNERGFNQSELISKELAAIFKIPNVSGKIGRFRSSSPQSLLAKKDRKLNVKGCFSVIDKNFFDAKRVLLVDDILTTGQTASECARTLREMGAKTVSVVVCARGL